MAGGHHIRSWDDYFIPGTRVLRNKFDEADPVRLAAREEAAVKIRLVGLARTPIRGNFDYAHMKAIHQAIFQDIYDWAGAERVGPATRMTKDGPDVINYSPGDPAAPTVAYGYYPGPQIAEAAERQYALLAREHHLVGLPPAQFVERLAEHWGELNTIHSFREGHTRAQFVFFTWLAEHAGYILDPDLFAPGQPLRNEFVWARFHNQATGRTDRLAAALDQAITPTEQTVRIHREALRAALNEREQALEPHVPSAETGHQRRTALAPPCSDSVRRGRRRGRVHGAQRPRGGHGHPSRSEVIREALHFSAAGTLAIQR